MAPTDGYTTTYLQTFSEVLTLISQTSTHESKRPIKVCNTSHVVRTPPIAYTNN